MIYFQICVNFGILMKNEKEREKREYIVKKGKLERFNTHPSSPKLT